MYQIDKALSDALVVKDRTAISWRMQANTMLKGFCFPTHISLRAGKTRRASRETFVDNFNRKAQPLFASSAAPNEGKTLILASILEKEVQSAADQHIVAGILEKRLAAGMPLDVDATVCYAKQVKNPTTLVNCASLAPADFKLDSPYNTYLYRGLPPVRSAILGHPASKRRRTRRSRSIGII